MRLIVLVVRARPRRDRRCLPHLEGDFGVHNDKTGKSACRIPLAGHGRGPGGIRPLLASFRDSGVVASS